MQASRDRTSGWTRAGAGLLHGWMGAGAVGLGMATSPTHAMMMQPQGQAQVVGMHAHEGGRASGATPGAVVDPCDPLGGARATEDVLEALDAALLAKTPGEMLALMPEQMRVMAERAIGGPARFHAALFGSELGAAPVVPTYQLTEAPVAGATIRALAGDGTIGFEASFLKAQSLDLAAGARALGDPSRVLAGEAAWNVSGVGMREGGRMSEFEGLVVAVHSREGLGYWMIIEGDSACPDFSLDDLQSQDADRNIPWEEVRALEAQLAQSRMLLALDITAFLRWCVNNQTLQRIAPWLVIRCWLVQMADRAIGNLILYVWLKLVLRGAIDVRLRIW